MFVEHKEALEVTETPAEISRLSQAIRVGAKLRGQCRHALFDQGRSCALGAAYEALTGNTEPVGTANVAWFLERKFRVPMPVLVQVTDYNDGLFWSRERIAEWLEAQGY